MVWSIHKAQCGVRVRWVHFGPLNNTVIVDLHQHQATFLQLSTHDYSYLSEQPNASQGPDPHVLVVDGLLKDSDLGTIVSQLIEWKKRHPLGLVVCVASEQQKLPRYNKVFNLCLYWMGGWKLEDYLAACQNESFLQSILPFLDAHDQHDEDGDIPAMIESKFYYAGHSARWFCQFSTQRIQQLVSYYVDSVSDLDKEQSGQVGANSEAAVNHLKTLFILSSDQCKRSRPFVSQYVSRCVVDKCSAQHILALFDLDFTKQNASFRGWVYEMAFLYAIKKSTPHFHSQDSSVQLRLSHDAPSSSLPPLSFHNVDELGQLFESDFVAGRYILPTKWNNALYDAIRCDHDGVFCIFNATVGLKHDLKLKYLNKLKNALKQAGVTVRQFFFFMVVPPHNVDRFTIDDCCTKIGQSEIMCDFQVCSFDHLSIGS